MDAFIIGIIAGSLCTISFLPQVIRIAKTRHTKDLSLVTFCTFSLGVSLWLIYGLILNQLPIILANAATLMLALIIVAMKLKFK